MSLDDHRDVDHQDEEKVDRFLFDRFGLKPPEKSPEPVVVEDDEALTREWLKTFDPPESQSA